MIQRCRSRARGEVFLFEIIRGHIPLNPLLLGGAPPNPPGFVTSCVAMQDTSIVVNFGPLLGARPKIIIALASKFLEEERK